MSPREVTTIQTEGDISGKDEKNSYELVYKSLEAGNKIKIKTFGRSMRPFLEGERDYALISPHKDFKIDDIVCISLTQDQIIMHRVIDIIGDTIITLGDGNLLPEVAERSMIIGKAIAFYRKGDKTPTHVTSLKWRVYSWLWTRLYPIRRYLLFIHRRLFIRQTASRPEPDGIET